MRAEHQRGVSMMLALEPIRWRDLSLEDGATRSESNGKDTSNGNGAEPERIGVEDDQLDDQPWPVETSVDHRSRGARALAVVAVFAFLGLVAANVLLWQSIDDAHRVTPRPRPVVVSGLPAINRRLSRLETETATMLASPPPGLAGQVDDVRASIQSVRACVAAFQQAVDVASKGHRITFTYC